MVDNLFPAGSSGSCICLGESRVRWRGVRTQQPGDSFCRHTPYSDADLRQESNSGTVQARMFL